jgi:hypothetical protein
MMKRYWMSGTQGERTLIVPKNNNEWEEKWGQVSRPASHKYGIY